MERGQIHGHKLNADSLGGYRLRWGLGSQTNKGVVIIDVYGGVTEFTDAS